MPKNNLKLIKKKSNIFISLFLLVFSLNILISDEINSEKIYANKNIKKYKLKDSITFAGVIVPLDYLDVKERLTSIFNVLVNDRRGMIYNLLSEYDNYIPNSQVILNSYGIHEDYAFIIAAESGMKNRVRSSKSASGPWQFIKSSARDKGLRVDATVNERNILDKSTHAAAKHIEELIYTSTCHEDPFLVLAAYNNGLRNVKLMLDSQGVDTFWDAVSNKETSDYVLRVIAYKEILINAERYGFTPILKQNSLRNDMKLNNTISFHLSLEDKKISFKNIAKYLGISYREFYLMNPHLQHDSYKKIKYIEKYSIVDIFIPENRIERLTDSLVFNNYIKPGKKELSGNTIDSLQFTDKNPVIEGNKDYTIYTVNEEKSLGEIAFKYNTSLDNIIKNNKDIVIKTNKNGIKIPIIKKGQKIRIYNN